MALLVPLFMQPVTGDPAITYTGQQVRGMFDVLSFLTGVTLKSDLQVSQRAAGANMTVDVSAGSGVIAGTSVAYQGKYLCQSTSTQSVTIAAAPGSGTRVDLVVGNLHDKQADGGVAYSWAPEVVTGIVGSGVPTIPNAFFPSCIPLAQVTVASGTSSITTALIKDVRLLNTLGDIPLWELRGGNGQAVPNLSPTTYSGWTTSELIGVDTNGTAGEMVVRQAGRYSVMYTARMDTGGTGTATRGAWIEQVRGGTVIRRIGSQDVYPNALDPVHGMVQTASGNARCNAGDVLRARSYQGSGSTLHLDDVNNELTFIGWRMPGS